MNIKVLKKIAKCAEEIKAIAQVIDDGGKSYSDYIDTLEADLRRQFDMLESLMLEL